jgi:predicted RecA/RadA family phage recombinase
MTMPVKTMLFATGDSVDYTPVAAAAAGSPVQHAGRVGVPASDIPAGRLGSLRVTGLFRGRKVTGAATRGQILGWDADADPVGGDAGTGAYTVDPAAMDYPVGTVEVDAAESDANVVFRLNHYERASLVPPGVKPGAVSVAADELAIPVTHAAALKTTGADAEALTLAGGTPGQILSVQCEAHGGGDGTLTPETATGFTTVTFDAAGEQVTLLYLDDTLGWIVLGAVGATVA